MSDNTRSVTYVAARSPQYPVRAQYPAINERLQRKLDYSLEEVRVLKEIFHAATGRERIPFTADQRRHLGLAG
jgi:hypothetical protein